MEENKNEELNGEISENPEVNTTNEIIEEKKSNKVIPIVVMVLAGLVIVAIAILIVISLISPKNTFFRLANNSFSAISKEISKAESSIWGKLLTVDTSSKLEIDANIKGKVETEDSEIKEWFKGLENFELVAKENTDVNNEYANANAEFSINGEKFMGGSMVKNKNMISLKMDDVTDGYITVDNNNLSALWEKIGYNGPSSLDNSADLLQELNFTKKDISDLKGALNKFVTGFAKAFDEEDFSKGTGTVEFDEGNIECKTTDFIVNAVDFNDGLVRGLEAVISKEKYIDAIYKFTGLLDKLAGYEPLSREEFGTNFERMLENIRSLEFTEEDSGFIIRLYHKGNNVVKMEVLSSDYNTKMLSVTTVNNGDSAYYKLISGISVYEDKVTTIDKVTTHAISIDFIDYETGEILEGYGSEINVTIDDTAKNEEIIKLNEKVRLWSYDVNLDETDIMAIEPTVVKDYTLRGSIFGNENNYDITLIDSDGTYSSTFSVVATIKENAKFEPIVISEEENFDTTKKSDEEIIAKKDSVVSNWNSGIGSDSNRVGQFTTAVATYLSAFIPMDYYSYNSTDY